MMECYNEVILETGARNDKLITMAIICLNMENGMLTMANAGHCFPIHFDSKSNKESTLLKATGIAGSLIFQILAL